MGAIWEGVEFGSRSRCVDRPLIDEISVDIILFVRSAIETTGFVAASIIIKSYTTCSPPVS
jgi:hypothetical protein